MISSPLVAPRLIGRDAECAFLMRRLDATVELGTASFTFVEGDAGMGKTRLLAELRRRAGELHALVVDVHALEHVRDPYGPFVLGIARAVDAAPGGAADALADVARALDPAEPLQKSSRLRAVASALRRILREHAVALLVEDVHWADRASLDLLGFFAVELAATPLFVVATRRPSEQTRDEPDVLRTGAHTVRLGPLADRDVGALLREALRGHGTVGADRLRRVTELSGGNPLYALELLRNAVAGAPDDVAPAIAYPIVRRWESLDRATREVLSAASAIGGDVDAAFVAAVTGRDEADVDKALERGRRVGLVETDRVSGGSRFAHALTRAAIEATIPPRARPALHRRIGELLEARGENVEPGRLAYHWTFAGDAVRVAGYNEAAGDRARALHDYGAAVRAFEVALRAVSPDAPSRARLNEKLAAAALMDAAPALATGALDAALDAYTALGDPLGVARIEMLRSRWAWYRGDPEEALAATQRAYRAAAPLGPSDVLFNVHVRLAQVYEQIANRADEARREVEAAEAMREHASPEGEIKFLNARGMLRAAEWELDGFVADFRDAIAIAERIGHVELLVSTQNNLALNAQLTGMPDVAIPALEAHVATAYQYGLAWHVPNGLLSLAHVRFVFGDVTGAAQALRDALASAGDVRRLETWIVAYGIPIALAAGDDALLQRVTIDGVLETALSGGDAWAVALTACACADAAEARGDAAGARDVVTRAIGALDAGARPLALCAYVAAYGRDQDLERARAMLDAPERDRVRAAERALFDAHVAMRRRRRTESAHHAQRAAEMYGALHWKMQQARALELAGRAADALRIYRAGGAIAEIARLERSARAADPLAPLTPREREIARLVLAGRSNREAGAELGLSERTVGNHLQSVFNRLGIGSRRELAEYVATAGDGTRPE